MSNASESNQDTHASDGASAEKTPVIGPLIAIAVGNTRTRVGLFRDSELTGSRSFESSAADQVAAEAVRLSESLEGDENPPVAMSSVDSEAADAIRTKIEGEGLVVGRFGEDLEIPIRHSLSEEGERTVGQDRLLCAIGAFATTGQASVVVDLGTALTVDFVDGEGTFHGGAIAPGLGMMLDALHQGTSALPQVGYQKPGAESAFGKDTPGAMRLGVTGMVCGAVRWLSERYALHYEAYPRIIATGGDRAVLEDDELVETFLPDLQLVGIRHACAILAADE